MEEIREQPTVEPADALNKAQEERAVSDVGSQDLGKFKDPQALLEAYNNLQAEFTRKSQLLAVLQKDKVDEAKDKETTISEEILIENDKKTQKNNENSDNIHHFQEQTIKSSSTIDSDNVKENQDNFHADEQENLDKLNQFLDENNDAKAYADEIKDYLKSNNGIKNPFENVWANIVLSHIKSNEKDDPIINQYIFSNEDLKNKIIENYLNELSNSRPPMVLSSQGGERVSGVFPDSPKSLAEAKKIVNNMFS